MTDGYDRMIVGRELDRHGRVGGPIGLPPETFTRHLLICGTTGTGKSTTATTAITTGHDATDGATIVIDPKGDGWAQAVARAHYSHTGSLDGVRYFDAAAALPATPFFDIRPDIAAGVDRLRAVQRVADGLLEILDLVRTDDVDAIRAPDVIRYLTVALFDPVHGSDVYGIDDLVTALYRLRNTETPDVSTAWAENLLTSVTAGTKRMRQTILQGSVTRVEKLYGDGYLRPLFSYTPDDPADGVQLADWLDEDLLVVLDLSGLSDRGQRVVAATLLAQLWRALKRRSARVGMDATPPTSLLFLDEVPHLRVEPLLSILFTQARGHGLGVVPMCQDPRQLGHADAAAYEDLLTNIHSVLAGRLPGDTGLADRLSGSTMSAAELTNRLSNLRDDWWLFAPASPDRTASVRPFTIAEAPLPPGHPDGPRPLAPGEQTAFVDALEACQSETATQYGVANEPYTLTAVAQHGSDAVEIDPTTASALEAADYATTLPLADSTLPDPVAYDPDRGAIVCDGCGTPRSADLRGCLEAIRCHGSLASVERTTIPPIELGLTLSDSEITAAPVSIRPLCGLQIMYNMAAERYDPIEVDLVHDRLGAVLDRVGITDDDIADLEAAGLVTTDAIREYEFYRVTAAGRDVLNEGHRKQVDWGHGKGDITEKLLHVAMVRALARYLTVEYVNDPTSPVERVIPYYELGAGETRPSGTEALDDRTRFDVVGLNAGGDVVVVGEAEVDNNDATGVIEDYDAMAALDPAEALWVVPSNSRGHEAVLQPLGDPPTDAGLADPSPRIKQYSSATRITQISGLDSPGMTEIHKLSDLRTALDPPSLTAAADRILDRT